MILEMISPRNTFEDVKNLLLEAKMNRFPQRYVTNIPEMVCYILVIYFLVYFYDKVKRSKIYV